jgi:hypothetical protein
VLRVRHDRARSIEGRPIQPPHPFSPELHEAFREPDRRIDHWPPDETRTLQQNEGKPDRVDRREHDVGGVREAK